MLDKGLHVRPPVPDEAHDDELVRPVGHLLGTVQVLYAQVYIQLQVFRAYIVSSDKPNQPLNRTGLKRAV